MPRLNDWNQGIIDQFRANEGRVGGPFADAPMILIHHIGARSGTERISPLVYFKSGERMVIVASKAGAPSHPDWYHNVKAHPKIDVEVGTERFPVIVEEVTGAERGELWTMIVDAMPRFGEYQAKTERRIPLLVLQRADHR